MWCYARCVHTRALKESLHLNPAPPAALPVNPGIHQDSANESVWLTVWTHQYVLVSADGTDDEFQEP